MSFPQVSVIVAVYNCRDTVERALRSALDQTIDAERVEVIAVDDGSTDGSGELLDELAGREPRLKVAHQPNSGGPGAPRNAGIDLAAGEFVYFLDSDDYLGPEALERMCAMADENGTDIVVGKYVGVRRTVPRWMFRRNFPRVTVADKDPGVYGSLSALKMFRRSMIERNKIRFAEGDLSGEDQIFTAHAFLHADGISVVGDYGCYYLVAREDRTSAVQRGGAPTKDYFARVAEVLEMIDRHLEPGELRDRLLFRHFNLEILGWRLGPRYIREDEPRRAEAYAAGRELVAGWMTPGVLERLEQRHRFTVHCLRHDLRGPMEEFMRFYHARQTPELVVEGDRAFAAYPGFRDRKSVV